MPADGATLKLTKAEVETVLDAIEILLVALVDPDPGSREPLPARAATGTQGRASEKGASVLALLREVA